MSKKQDENRQREDEEEEENTDEENEEQEKEQEEEMARALIILTGKSKSITVKEQKELRTLFINMYNRCKEQVGVIRTLEKIVNQKLNKVIEKIDTKKNEVETATTTTNSSYANAVKKPKQTDEYKIIITPKARQDSEETKKLIKTEINPIEKKLSINAVRKLKNGKLEIRTPTIKDKEEITSLLKKNDKIEIEEKRKNKPRLILDNVGVEYENDNDIIDILFKQNDVINQNYTFEQYKSDIKVRTQIKNNRYPDAKKIIIEVTGKLRNLMIKDKLNIGWRRTIAKDYTTLLQCYNCCGVGHTSKKCTITTTCARCAGSHDTRQCREEIEYCILCHIENKKGHKEVNPYHTCTQDKCITLINIKKNIINAIDYN